MEDCGMIEASASHLVCLPMEEGTLLHSPRLVQASLLHPHPLADAGTPGRRRAKAGLRGDGRD